MIRISCSILERVRKNHAAYAEILSEEEKIPSRGTFGMFSHWKETAKRFHAGELNLSEAIKAFQSSFRRFEDTKRNREKQAKLEDEFIKYARHHKLDKLTGYQAPGRMAWPITAQIRLTGITPWIFQRDGLYYAYYCLEKTTDWQTELRYPLLQYHLSREILRCRLNVVYIGIYCLQTDQFEFRCFSLAEVRAAITEVTRLFNNLYTEYSRLRAGAGE
jgi:hypothetical protein